MDQVSPSEDSLPLINSAFVSNTPSEIASENLLNEYVIFSQAYGPHVEITLKETLETVALASRILRRKYFYGKSPHLLLLQIFKIVGKRLWRVQADHNGMQIALGIFFVSEKGWWIAISPKVHGFWYRQGVLSQVAEMKKSEQLFGQVKYVTPSEDTGDFKLGDRLLLVSNDIAATLNMHQLQELTKQQLPLTQIAESLMDAANKRRQGKYAVWVIERVRPDPKQMKKTVLWQI